MGDSTTILIIGDGFGNYRVTSTPGRVEARMEVLQAGNAFPLSRVYTEVAPAEMAPTILAGVRVGLATKRIHHDWYRAPKDEVIDAVNRAVRSAAELVARPAPGPSPEPPPQRPTGPDIDPPATAFDEALEDVRERVNLQGRASRNLREPWQP